MRERIVVKSNGVVAYGVTPEAIRQEAQRLGLEPEATLREYLQRLRAACDPPKERDSFVARL